MALSRIAAPAAKASPFTYAIGALASRYIMHSLSQCSASRTILKLGMGRFRDESGSEPFSAAFLGAVES